MTSERGLALGTLVAVTLLPAGAMAAALFAFSDTTGARGTATMVQLLYSNPNPCAGMEMILNFDRQQVALDRVEPTPRLSGISDVGFYEYTDGKTAIVVFDANGADIPAGPSLAPILNLYFNVSSTALGGSASLFLTDVAAVLPDLTYDDVQIQNGTIVPVVLSSFVAQAARVGIKLDWEIDSDGISGFILDRQLAPSSDWMRLTEQPLPAHPPDQRGFQYSFFDETVEVGLAYTYQLSAVDAEQRVTVLGHVAILFTPPLPARLDISRNFPNPFNPSTRFRVEVPKTQKLTVRLYDLAGRLVRELVGGDVAAGYHVLTWDGTDQEQRPMASGLYFCRLQGESFSKTVKIMMLK